MSRYIAIDLELEQPFSNNQTPDSCTDTEHIIQVGIVVFELAAQEPTILASETHFVEYGNPISEFIRTLTGITNEQVNTAHHTALTVVHRLNTLRNFFDTSRQIVEWGGGDVVALLKQANLEPGSLGFARSTINAKTLFQCYCVANDKKPKSGLSKSLEKVGLDFKCTHYDGKNRGKHWAESDALNTARIFNKLINLFRRDV